MGRAAHLMKDTVTVAEYSGTRGAGGDPAYNAQATVKCMWEKKAKLVMNADGNEEMAEGRLIAETEIPLLSRVWLPGADITKVNESKKPIAVGGGRTPGRYELFEVWL